MKRPWILLLLAAMTMVMTVPAVALAGDFDDSVSFEAECQSDASAVVVDDCDVVSNGAAAPTSATGEIVSSPQRPVSPEVGILKDTTPKQPAKQPTTSCTGPTDYAPNFKQGTSLTDDGQALAYIHEQSAVGVHTDVEAATCPLVGQTVDTENYSLTSVAHASIGYTSLTSA